MSYFPSPDFSSKLQFSVLFQLKDAGTRVNILVAIGDDALNVFKRAKFKVFQILKVDKIFRRPTLK